MTRPKPKLTPLGLKMERQRKSAPSWRCTLCGATARPKLLWSVSDSGPITLALPIGWAIHKGSPICQEHKEAVAALRRLARA